MRTIHILFIFFLIPVSGITQVAFNSTRHDFGDLESYDLRYIDIVLSNKGQKEAWVLSVKKPREVAYIISNQIIPKDSTTVLRFQINPKQKGRFNYSIVTREKRLKLNCPEIYRI
ncbi:MAG: Ig-like domain-containing protein [Flavobacteriales bacterium]